MKLSDFIEGCERLSNFTNDVDIHNLISDLKKINESQKVTVPQFVADWIEERKDEGWQLSQMFLQANLEEKFGRWIVDNQETFARAWIDGYQIDKEKRYKVRAKGVYYNSDLIFDKTNKKWFFSSIYETDHQRASHTRKELEKAGFGWVFDCEGMEVEEV